MDPIICFGQQPNGILPKRFFMAKLATARRLQEEIGGKIVWFLHDSDHDPRETRTRLPAPSHPDGFVDINFPFTNKLQRRFTPLAKKQFTSLEHIRSTLLHVTNPFVVSCFDAVQAKTVSQFCVDMYKNLGLLDGIEVISSFSPAFREQSQIADTSSGWFADVLYQEQLVRAQLIETKLRLHHGGDAFTDLGQYNTIVKTQLSAGRDKRFDWMQSVLHCTHYVVGESEQKYLENTTIQEKPVFVPRERVEDASFAFIPEEK